MDSVGGSLPRANAHTSRALLSAGLAVEIYKCLPEKRSDHKSRSIELSKRYSVAPKTIQDVWGRKTWREATQHLYAPPQHVYTQHTRLPAPQGLPSLDLEAEEERVGQESTATASNIAAVLSDLSLHFPPSRWSESLRVTPGEAEAERGTEAEEGGMVRAGGSGDGDGGLQMVDVMLKLCLQRLGAVVTSHPDHSPRGVPGGAAAAAAQGAGVASVGPQADPGAEAVARGGLEAQVEAVEARVAALRAHVAETTSALHREEEVWHTAKAQVESLRQISGDTHRLLAERDAVHEQLAEVEAVLGADRPAIEEGRECVVCWSRTSEIALIPCGHVCLCSSCPPLSVCPMCRAEVESSLRVYLP